jgi:hypothetical protein
MWWNFVSSRKERIQKAMDDWKQGNFGAVYDDNGTPAPLPESDSYSLMSEYLMEASTSNSGTSY